LDFVVQNPCDVPSAPARTRAWWSTGWRILAGIVTGLSLSECIYSHTAAGTHVHLNRYQAHPVRGFGFQPDVCQRHRLEDKITEICTDKLGFRNPAQAWNRPNEILLLGDSQVMGLGVEYEQSMAAILEKQSHKNVYSAAIPDYGPREYQLLLEELVPKLHPKQVILVYSFNTDVIDQAFRVSSTMAVSHGWLIHKAKINEQNWILPIKLELMNHSHILYRLFLPREEKQSSTSPYLDTFEVIFDIARDYDLYHPSDPSAGNVVHSLFDKPILKAQQYCQEHAVQLKIAALPMDVQVSPKAWDKYDAPTELRKQTNTKMVEQLVTSAHAKKIAAVNLLPDLRAAEGSTYFSHDPHLNATGHLVVGSVLTNLVNSP
jgi:hypothetical protein